MGLRAEKLPNEFEIALFLSEWAPDEELAPSELSLPLLNRILESLQFW